MNIVTYLLSCHTSYCPDSRIRYFVVGILLCCYENNNRAAQPHNRPTKVVATSTVSMMFELLKRHSNMPSALTQLIQEHVHRIRGAFQRTVQSWSRSDCHRVRAIIPYNRAVFLRGNAVPRPALSRLWLCVFYNAFYTDVQAECDNAFPNLKAS